MTLTLTEFLLARIAERIAALQDCPDWIECHPTAGCPAHGDTSELLAECEAKRRIVEEYRAVPDGMQGPYRAGLGRAMQCLAVPYATHPDYREDWRP